MVSLKIVCNGQVYPSISDFAKEYGFNYSTVRTYVAQGMSGDEIVDRINSRLSPSGKSKTSFTYDGKDFSSLSDAVQEYGLSLYSVYRYKGQHHCSSEEAIDHFLKKRAKTGGPTNSGGKKPVVFRGVEYPSQQAVMDAFHLPRVTVMSKIRRTGVSFETAVEQCLHASNHLSVTRSPFLSTVWKETDNTDSFLRIELKILNHIRSSFQNTKIYSSDIGIHMVSFEADIVLGVPSTVYVVFDKTEKEFFIEDIHVLKGDVPIDKINKLNASSLYTKFWFDSDSGKIGASWNVPATSDIGNAPIIWKSLLNFVNACRELNS